MRSTPSRQGRQRAHVLQEGHQRERKRVRVAEQGPHRHARRAQALFQVSLSS